MLRTASVGRACLLAGLLASSASWADTTLRTAAQVDSDPKYVDVVSGASHSVSGVCVDIFRAMESANPSLHIVGDQSWQPGSRVEYMLEIGRLDIACGLVHSPEREKQFRFIEPHLFTFHYGLAARADDDVKITSWDDVRKLKPDNIILANHRWGSTSQLEKIPGLNVDSRAYDSGTNLKKLLAGHGRFFFFRDPGFSLIINKAGMHDRVRVLPTVMTVADTYMAVRKDLPEAAVAEIQKALVQITADGVLTDIKAKWNLTANDVPMKDAQ